VQNKVKPFHASRRHYVFDLSVRLCVRACGTGVPADAFSNRLAADFFYRAMLCIRGTSHGPVSVSMSVTSRCSVETAERIELVLARELLSTRPTLC